MMRDLVDTLVASNLTPGWRVAWLLVFTVAAALLFAGALVGAQLVVDELKPWIARVRTRAFRRQAAR